MVNDIQIFNNNFIGNTFSHCYRVDLNFGSKFAVLNCSFE